MKRYTIIYSALAVMLGTLISSCKKNFLAETPYSAYAPITLTDSLGFEAALVGLYNQHSTWLTYSGRQGYHCLWQVGTDVANSTANQEGIEVPYYNYATLTSSDAGASYTWGKFYTLINNANNVIDQIEGQNVKGVTKGRNRIDAEARFFRAYGYNTLATLYGRVPLVVHSLTAPKTDYTRASLTDVNAQIIADLTYACANLPDVGGVGAKTNPTTGLPASRANKWMAYQLLAEVYLRTGQNDLAETTAQAIISSGKFSLVSARFGSAASLPGDYYSDIFKYGNQRRSQNNPEVIWTLEQENPTTLAGGNTDNAQQRRIWGAAYYNIAGLALADSLGGRSIARMRISNWVIYGLYGKGDIRNSGYNLRRRFVYNDPAYPALLGKPVPYNNADTLFKTCPYITKWGQFDPNDTFGYAMIKDFILMRLGETYLLLAEAQVQQGKTAAAAATINVLRTRAGAAQVTASQMTLDFILDERARELIGEENRRMTLMRTGTLVDRATRLNANDAAKPISGLTKTNLLLPIPLSEIQLNKDAVLEQNPGYN
ncbi:putative outer membrane starch-binding protein [Mucilaginibacter yixingensis]|uniref:Putative outer membrane starch-binding protein n=1 Tax=Mucilaginibacter yixingensis TaxID=1295612 RepID=A0A2T5JGB0_9SPHI|nr:RagB/SusD family nutrient uptake outer membrane protein [Mucilaginibacter yixingensis]PTR01445.1 putative outer membrane starch-binding protein [Mucilaginibacter yixingensis]